MTLLVQLAALEAECRQALFDRNTRLAFSALKRHGRHLSRHDREDLGQALLVALWRAACGFDPRYGWKFSTYAVTCLNRAAVSEWKRRGRERAGTLADAADTLDRFPAAERREPEQWGESEWERRLDAIPDPRKREAVRLRYRDEACVDSIAARLGVTRQRVRQMLAAGVAGLREAEGVGRGEGLFAEMGA